MFAFLLESLEFRIATNIPSKVDEVQDSVSVPGGQPFL